STSSVLITNGERVLASACCARNTTENGVRSSSSVVSYAPKIAIPRSVNCPLTSDLCNSVISVLDTTSNNSSPALIRSIFTLVCRTPVRYLRPLTPLQGSQGLCHRSAL